MHRHTPCEGTATTARCCASSTTSSRCSKRTTPVASRTSSSSNTFCRRRQFKPAIQSPLHACLGPLAGKLPPHFPPVVLYTPCLWQQPCLVQKRRHGVHLALQPPHHLAQALTESECTDGEKETSMEVGQETRGQPCASVALTCSMCAMYCCTPVTTPAAPASLPCSNSSRRVMTSSDGAAAACRLTTLMAVCSKEPGGVVCSHAHVCMFPFHVAGLSSTTPICHLQDLHLKLLVQLLVRKEPLLHYFGCGRTG